MNTRSSDEIRLTQEAVRSLSTESPTALAVLCRVLWRGRRGECWASVATLGKDGVPLSARSVAAALRLLVDGGYLTRTERGQATLFYSAGPKCPAKPHNSVFVPPAAWRTLKPAQLAYWCVRAAHGRGNASRCALDVVETARMVRSARGTTSRATAYRLHAALVAAGLIAVSKRVQPVSKTVVGQSQSSTTNTETAIRRESNTEIQIPICNTYSSGAKSPWEGVSLSALSLTAKSPREGERMTTDGKWEGAKDAACRGRGVSPKTGQADGRTPVEFKLCGSVGDGMGPHGQADRERQLCAVPSRRPEASGDAQAPTLGVLSKLPRRTRADFLGAWGDLRQRAGGELCLRPTLLSTGLPSGEESLLFAAFRELSDDDTHELATVGDWLSAGGLRWHREKGMSPWRYLARNFADCLSRAIEWAAKGRPAIGGSTRYTGADSDEDYDITERATLVLLRGGK